MQSCSLNHRSSSLSTTLTRARLADTRQPSHAGVWQTWSHEHGWQPPAQSCVVLCPPRQVGFVRGVCRMWLGDPSGQRQLPCQRSPGRGRGARQKALFVLPEVSGTRRAGAELGLFIGSQACWLRNAGCRLELAGAVCAGLTVPWSTGCPP